MSKHVLVVDDQISMRETLTDMLEILGYSSAAAGNGEEALVLLEHESFDLVIADLNMPRMDGIALLGRIKETRPDLPVVIITGYRTVHTEKKILQKGADGFIPKPCTLKRVKEIVAAALRNEIAAPSPE
ncbi:MAG: response regulator [Candidatus Eisenbacteria sp.]|nr:response regulator [Candidatus Eisenbacteria bacterium]